MDVEIAHRAITQFYDAKLFELSKEFYELVRKSRVMSFASLHIRELKMSTTMGDKGTLERWREYTR